MKSNLHKIVMRRVYYSYIIRVLSEPMLWQGVALGVCIALFGRLTHVAAIAHNVGETKLEQVPTYIVNSFMHALYNGEVLTVLVVLFIVGLSAKFFYRAAQVLARGERLKTA